MATVTGLTAERMLEIEDASVVSGVIDEDGHLILTTHGGDEIDAGNALIAVPDATTADKGVSELATQVETEAHTDTVRAVTPASLASTFARIVALEDELGDRVQIITAPAETDGQSSYPTGVSVAVIGTGSGWTINGGFGTILTVNVNSNRCYQTISSTSGGTQTPNTWVRTYHSTNGGGGWTVWAQFANDRDTTSVGMVGEIKMWPTSTIPAGWQVCDGSAINRTTYPRLFAILGTTYGAGNGTTTFNVPNMQGRMPVGFDSGQTEFDATGETGGAKTHTLTSSEMPAHTHTNRAPNWNVTPTVGGNYAGFDTTMSNTEATGSTGSGGAHNNMPPYIVMRFIIKLG